ncbi:AAA family ATPase [Candidatus Woesearchaeota archaeon]|nr:AAA family ATPase [Candidatus Woesearchaeota archaeon]
MSFQDSGELVILGGAKGTGKTTLAQQLCSETGMTYIHPGSWFIKYWNKEHPLETEKRIVDEILQLRSPLIDIHYASYVKGLEGIAEGYVQGLCDSSIKQLAERYSPVVLYLVEVDASTLMQRRLCDNKRRKLELTIIEEELSQNRKGWEHFRELMSSCTEVKPETIANYEIEVSLAKIIQGCSAGRIL